MTAIASFFRSSSRLCRVVPAIIFAAAVVATIPAPVASAETEQQIQGECEGQGGHHSTRTASNGNQVSQCCIQRFAGGGKPYWDCNYYVNGEWDGNHVIANGQPPPPPDGPQPGPPPGVGNQQPPATAPSATSMTPLPPRGTPNLP